MYLNKVANNHVCNNNDPNVYTFNNSHWQDNYSSTLNIYNIPNM